MSCDTLCLVYDHCQGLQLASPPQWAIGLNWDLAARPNELWLLILINITWYSVRFNVPCDNETDDTNRRIPPISSFHFSFLAYTQLNMHYHPSPNNCAFYDIIDIIIYSYFSYYSICHLILYSAYRLPIKPSPYIVHTVLATPQCAAWASTLNTSNISPKEYTHEYFYEQYILCFTVALNIIIVITNVFAVRHVYRDELDHS